MRRFWKGSDDLEVRLRASRAEPRPEFLNALVGRLERNRRTFSLRVVFASGLTIAGLAVFGATGRLGHASSAAHSLVSSIASQPNTDPGNGNGNNGNSNNADPTTSSNNNGNGNGNKTDPPPTITTSSNNSGNGNGNGN